MTRKKAKQPDDVPPAESPEIDAIEDMIEGGPAVVPADEPMTVEDERDDLLARLQRLSADYVNYQKRARRDIDQTRQFANDDLIKALLPVIDDMERALAAARDNHGEDDPLFQGMQLVHDKALETLGRFGVTVIEAAGEPFDPDRHTAMMQQADQDHEPNTVLQEVQRGYELRGRILRPSAVVISKMPDSPGADNED